MDHQLLEYALKYAELGWKVIPIKPRQKVPLTKHGIKDATDRPETIRAWWTTWPNANIAVACGKPSGVYVIDIDLDKEKSVNGYESLKEFPVLPDTVVQQTPRGGYHAFYRTDNPPANKNSFRPGIDLRGDGYYVLLAPSIHPNKKQYEWIQGASPWDIKPTEYPNFMRPTKKAAPLTFRGVPIVHKPNFSERDNELYVTGTFPADDILKRASLYLAQCDPAIQGYGGHDKLLTAAVKMVHGFLLSDGQALNLLMREYNPRCIPPWDFSVPKDDKDFRRKVTEARKLTPSKPLGWLLQDDDYSQIQTLVSPAQAEAVVKMVEKAVAKEKQETCSAVLSDMKQSPNGPPEPGGIAFWLQKGGVSIDRELEFLIRPPGLLGEICSWINDTALMPQPFLTLACSLAFLGTLFGRKVRDKDNTRTNLYYIGVADTSSGKNHAPTQIREICLAAGCLDLLGGTSTTGDAAIESRLEKNPASLFFWDEIGFLLTKAASGLDSSQFGLVPYLMQLYSAARSVFLGREYTDADKRRTIIQPCCSIYGTSTPDRFTPALTPGQISDGFLARCLIFHGDEDPAKDWCDSYPELPDEISKQVTKWYARRIGETDGTDISAFATYSGALGKAFAKPPEQLVVEYDKEARDIFLAFDDECICCKKKDPHLGKLWLKGVENAKKVAIIVACGINYESPRVTSSTANYSCRLIRYLLKDFMEKTAPEISSGQLDKQKQEILHIIKNKGLKGCSNRELTRSTRWANANLRKSILMDLHEGEEIISKPIGKTVYFWTMGGYAELLASEDASE